MKRFQTQIRLIIASLSGAALLGQEAARYDFLGIPDSAAIEGDPIRIRLQALTASGLPAVEVQHALSLTAERHREPPPLISEVGPRRTFIEITVPGRMPRDLSGWEIQAFPVSETAPCLSLRIPQGTWVAGGGCLMWGANPVDGVPSFVRPEGFQSSDWSLMTVLLRDPAGAVADQVVLQQEGGERLATISRWRNPALRPPDDRTRGHSRIGGRNRFGGQDWAESIPSPGVRNPDLTFPWSIEPERVAILPEEIQLSGGSWSGEVRVFGSGAMVLVAVGTNGLGSLSREFSVVPGTRLSLIVGDEVREASESRPGPLGTAEILLAAALRTNLTVTLASSPPSEFGHPAFVVIAAGETRAQFALTNRDDSLPDGAASVTLSASAPGFGIATAQLINADNETGSVLLRVPALVHEGSGWPTEPASVLLTQPSAHDVVVDLEATPSLRVPSKIIVPAGHLSAPISLEVLDDALLNERQGPERVRATVRGWPSVEQSVLVVDDESPAAELQMPTEVVEGIPAEAQVRLLAARTRPVSVGITSVSGGIRLPAQRTIPAGEVLAQVPLLAVDNATPQPVAQDALCVTLDGDPLECRPISIVDDEVSLQVLQVYSFTSGAFDGEPFRIQVRLMNDQWQVQRTNGLVRLQTSTHPSLVRVAAESEFVQATNGVFEGMIRLEGSALDVRLIATTSGLTAESHPIDVLQGHSLRIRAADLAVNPATSRILLLESGWDRSASQALVEVEPKTGSRLRTLELPRPAVAINVSDDGRVAWLASEMDTLQRVDLEQWKVSAEVMLPPQSRPLRLLVLPGSPERVVVQNTREVAGHLDAALIGVESGVVLPGEIPALLSGFCRGRTPTEFFGIGDMRTLRMEWTPGGLAEQAVWPNFSVGATLFLFGDRLFASGSIFDPESMVPVDMVPQGLPGTATYFPQSGLMGMLRGAYAVMLVDPAGWVPRDGFRLPATYEDDQNRPLLARWGSRGIAVLDQQADQLILTECPQLQAPEADLELTGQAPASVPLTPNSLGPGGTAAVRWELTITNRGPGVMPRARILRGSNEWATVGSLFPSEGRTLAITNYSDGPALLQERFTVVGPGSDPNPLNNEVHLGTVVHGLPFPGTRTLYLPARHLIGAPAGDRLFAAVPSGAGNSPHGVAEIDPIEGRVVRVLASETEPSRLAISPDGARLYAKTGPRQLIWWNLPTGERGGGLETADQIFDFLVFPGPGQPLFVATAGGIETHGPDRTPARQWPFPVAEAQLAVSRGLLWWAGEWLQAYQVSGSSLTAVGELTSLMHPALPSGIRMDDQRLYRQGLSLDLNSRVWRSAIIGNDIVPDATNSAIFSLDGVSIFRHDPATFARTGGGPIAEEWGNSRDLVRWGKRGFAFRTLEGVVYLSESSVIPSAELCDLAVHISPQDPWRSYAPFSHRVTVTNRSDRAAHPFQVTVTVEGDVIEMESAGLPAHRSGNSLMVHLLGLEAHDSVSLVVRGSMRPGPASLRASVAGDQADPEPTNNQASSEAVLTAPRSSLAIERFMAPARARPNEEFEVTALVRNQGPELAPNVQLHLQTWMDIVFTSPGTLTVDCCSKMLGLGTLDPGATVEVSLRLRATTPGLNHLNLIPRSEVSDPNRNGDAWQRLVYVPATMDDAAGPGLSLPLRVLWNDARQQWVGAYPSAVSSVYLLSKDELDVVNTWDLPGPVAQFTITSDGLHAWVLLEDGRAMRVNLDTGAMDLSFLALGPGGLPGFWAIQSPPDHPEDLVVAAETDSGEVTVSLYRSGIRAPASVQIPDRAIMPLSMAAGPGRFYVSTGMRLRELATAEDGVVEVRNLDAVGGGQGKTFAENRLVINDGRIVRTDIPDSVPPRFATGVAAADPITKTIYAAGEGADLNLNLVALDPATLAPLWMFRFPDVQDYLMEIVPMGTNGLLLLGNTARVVRAPSPEPAEPDVRVSTIPGESIAGTNLTAFLSATVASPGPWSVPGILLGVELPPELEFADPTVPSGQRHQTRELGALVEPQSVLISVRSIRPGSGIVRWTVSSALPDSQPANNVAETLCTVLPPPELLFEDVATEEGSTFERLHMTAALTRDAPYPMEVQFRVTPPKGGERNVVQDQGILRFEAGSRLASAVILSGDDNPDPDKIFQVTFTSEHVGISRATAAVTLLNDDFSSLSIWSNSSFSEGDFGISEAVLEIEATGSAGMRPVEFDFRIVGLDATEGTDFLATSGRMVLTPGVSRARIVIPVVGDRLFEPPEWVGLRTLGVRGAIASGERRVFRIMNDDAPPAPRVAASQGSIDSVRLEFDTVAGAIYEVFSTPDLSATPWRAHAVPPIGGDGQRHALDVPLDANSLLWFQVRAR